MRYNVVLCIHLMVWLLKHQKKIWNARMIWTASNIYREAFSAGLYFCFQRELSFGPHCLHNCWRMCLRKWYINNRCVHKFWISWHDDVIKWKHFPRNWPFVREAPVNSPHKGQWHGALMFTLISAQINGWVNNRDADDLRRNRAHYDVIVLDRCGFRHCLP